MKRFGHLDRPKVSSLLEELDNNLDLAIQILQEEMDSNGQIIEERR